MKKVAVVILNFKAKDNTLKCVESVRKSDYKNLEIIVVDNNSGDDLGEELRKMNDVCFIQNMENSGFTGGNNIGIKKALEDGVEYVFILNMDTVIDSRAISNLVREVDENNAGIAGSKILYFDKKTIWYAGGTLDLANVLGGHRGVDEVDHGQYDKTEETQTVTGCAMMVSREVLDKVGLFDERYFLYYEDSDFCFRTKKAGFKLIYVPSAVVYHENAASTVLGSPRQDYFISRNRMLFASKFLSFRTKFAIFREALRNLNNPVRRLAFWDFLTGNFGKGSYVAKIDK